MAEKEEEGRAKPGPKPKEKPAKKEYSTGPVAPGALARMYGDWVRRANETTIMLGGMPMPEQLISGFIEPAAQRLIDHFTPKGMAADLVCVVAPIGQNAINSGLARKMINEEGCKVVRINGKRRLQRPDGQILGGEDLEDVIRKNEEETRRQIEAAKSAKEG